MIVDCHTQIWDGSGRETAVTMCPPRDSMRGDTSRHLEAVGALDRAIVLAFKSAYLGAEVPNQRVADYVRRNASKLIGFAGIDPTEPNCLDDLAEAQEGLGLKGVTISPALQNFHPSDTRAMEVYAECARRGMPVIFEQANRNPAARMEYARPHLLDEVAREFPGLRIVVAHMGFPWVTETLVLLGKHEHVYADVSGLLPQPWISYNALLPAYEFGVMDKLLFGSDFPFRSPVSCIEALYSVNQISHGTSLVTIPREQLRGIVERDALSLLGIADPIEANPPSARQAVLLHDE